MDLSAQVVDFGHKILKGISEGLGGQILAHRFRCLANGVHSLYAEENMVFVRMWVAIAHEDYIGVSQQLHSQKICKRMVFSL